MKTSIKFINHASVIVSDDNISLLSDPWYQGDVFHKGWNLLHEISDTSILDILKNITHIWISHEHPDHFSILFFKKFSDIIKQYKIKIFFQKTEDKRVYKYLISQGLDVEELNFNTKYYLSQNFCLTCIKDGFYDSGLLVESNGEKILNLNDCEITSLKRANEVFLKTGTIDVLLTQFSYAAWKGGKKNKKWRDEAANDKIKTIKLQIEKFQPKYVIPFASFIYFSNNNNFYLNDSANQPDQIKIKLNEHRSKIIIMAPNDTIGGKYQSYNEDNAIKFWSKKYQELNLQKKNKYSTVDLNLLENSFKDYCDRIHRNNNMWLIKLIRKISPVDFFKPVIINIFDLFLNVKFDYVNKIFIKTNENPMLSMHSESLNFIYKNSFGFDTLTVNGCFEEVKKDGFVNATKTLAIENLNNLGVKVEFKTLFNFSIIILFFNRLFRVSKKLDL